MEKLNILLVVLLVPGADFCSFNWRPESVLNLTVSSGDNVTLYCDCKALTGWHIVWFKNCSHENQPPLVLDIIQITRSRSGSGRGEFPRFEFVKNFSSDSYDLLILNVSESDEGFYYCGTKETRVDDFSQFSNITTRLTVKSSKHSPDVCWKVLFTVCPALFVLSTLLSFCMGYLCCQKTGKQTQDDGLKHEASTMTEITQQEDVCYAALELKPSQKVKRKKTSQSSDYSTYCTVNKSRGLKSKVNL